MPNSLSNQTVENVVQVESISSDLGGVKVGLVTEFSDCMASQNCLPPRLLTYSVSHSLNTIRQVIY